MKKMFRIQFCMIAAASAIVFSPILNGQEEGKLTAAEVLENVRKMYDGIKDMSAKFNQTVTLKYANIEQSFSGSLTMKKGKKYRIESEQQTIATDGKTVWAYSPINHQVLIDAYSENAQTFSPDRFLFNLPENYSAVFIEEKDPEVKAAYIVKLQPKHNASSLVKSIKMWVDDADWSVHKIEYVDMNDTKTVFVLRDIKFDTGISDTTFNFTIPPNTEIVDLRTKKDK